MLPSKSFSYTILLSSMYFATKDFISSPSYFRREVCRHRNSSTSHTPVPMVWDEPNTYHTMGTTMPHSSRQYYKHSTHQKYSQTDHIIFGRTSTVHTHTCYHNTRCKHTGISGTQEGGAASGPSDAALSFCSFCVVRVTQVKNKPE